MTTPEPFTNEEIVELLEKAFLPTRCKAILEDYGRLVEFKLLDQNDKVTLTVKGTKVDSLRDVKSIDELCSAVLARLRAKSIKPI